MRLNYLSLTNFRNYTRLELALPDRLTVVQGSNAQGKTNLLEAIHLLATGRSPRAVAERELINWLALDSLLPYARLAGDIGEGAKIQRLELVLESARYPTNSTATNLQAAPETGQAAAGTDDPVLLGPVGNGPAIRKQVRINDSPKRALDLVGRLRVVLFLPEDVSLVAGSPSERRRYLDIALCQMTPAYCRALGEYNRVITQRNALLKRLRDEGGDVRQLNFWNTRAVEFGAVLVHQRLHAIQGLDQMAADRHASLTDGGEKLRLNYLPGVDLDPQDAKHGGGQAGRAGRARRHLGEVTEAYLAMSHATIQERFLAQLHALQRREIAAGTSLAGPHRDDMSFVLHGHDLRAFGSRGQQRTAALALRLAELELMRSSTGDSPLLLLDDVMSELDMVRRQALLMALSGVAQAIVTTTDLTDFGPEFLRNAATLHVEQGVLSPVSPH
jgi:DNA replication and repair protein RecF